MTHNMRLRCLELFYHIQQLAAFGPAKLPAEQGLDEGVLGPAADPTKQRVGLPPEPVLQQKLLDTVEEVKAALSSDRAARRRALPIAEVAECLAKLRGACMIAFPQGLPEYDPVRIILDDDDDHLGNAEGARWYAGTQTQRAIRDALSDVLWVGFTKCVKRDDPEKPLLSDYFGTNDKSKVVVRPARAGMGAPAKDASKKSEGELAMMSYYHQRQEALRKLDQQDPDDAAHIAAGWADPSALRKQFHGMSSDIRFR
eukprot:gnl/Ergobibamus_cyprinoides/2056.p1 GENE.gnl/Ergobibamus_cyprinoides/2056~~gnl/Ergobibamus_cyprinoides/2056.p1  ORF type:complete len:297 (+),score=58.83 gnl/Ergobibamus_cyprinoides/2056:124-891(+)